MAIIHNLATASDNLSGVDPMEGISDGTAVGRSWICWKIAQLIVEFDSTFKIITDSEPTPEFLRSSIGSNLQTEPALDRTTSNDSIRLYNTNDYGLTSAVSSSFIYEFKMTSTAGYSSVAMARNIAHITSGSSIWYPTQNLVNNGLSSDANVTLMKANATSTTYTVMTNIPKIILWKSSNCLHICCIDKLTNAFFGGGTLYINSWTGYKHTVGELTQGGNLDLIVSNNNGNGATTHEAFTQIQNGAISSLGAFLSPIWSLGRSPAMLLDWSGSSHVVGGKLRFSYYSDTTASGSMVAISDEVEGVYIMNPANVSLPTVGQIALLGTHYYLGGYSLSNGRDTYRCYFDLGTGSV